MLSLFTRSCEKIRGDFSAYIDGAVSGRTMQAIETHLKSCLGCAAEFEEWRATQRAVASLSSVKAPADLALRLRVAMSQERARKQVRWIDQISVQWQNVVGPLVLQVSSGLAAAIVLVGSIVMMLGVAPEAVLANDEPLGAVTAPHYLHGGPSVGAIHTAEDTVIVVAVDVNTQGEVYNYQVLSGSIDEGARDEVLQHLLLSVFQPASVFGEPVNGHAVVTFSGVAVHG